MCVHGADFVTAMHEGGGHAGWRISRFWLRMYWVPSCMTQFQTVAKDLQVRATVPEGVIDTMCLHADAAVWFFCMAKHMHACMQFWLCQLHNLQLFKTPKSAL